MAFRFNGASPPPPQANLELWRVTSAETVVFVCVSRYPWGQWIHWYGSRSHECLGEKNAVCPRCHEGQPKKWKAFLHVLRGTELQEGFLELTRTALEQIEKQMHDRDDLRGVRLRIRKTKGGAKGRYIVDVLPPIGDIEKLPTEKDPIHLLRKLWACNADRLTGKKVNGQRPASDQVPPATPY